VGGPEQISHEAAIARVRRGGDDVHPLGDGAERLNVAGVRLINGLQRGIHARSERLKRSAAVFSAAYSEVFKV